MSNELPKSLSSLPLDMENAQQNFYVNNQPL